MTDKINHQTLERAAENALFSEDLMEELFVTEKKLLPGKQDWRKFLEIFLLSFGALSLVSGVIFFFAYNWADLHRLGKAAVSITLFLISTAVTIRQKSGTLPWKVSAMTTVSFIGVNLALLGQIYQTGADAWQLFFWWSLLAIPYAVIVNFVPLWLFVTIIGQTALSLLSVQWFGGSMLWFHGLPLTLIFIILSYRQKGSVLEQYQLYRTLTGSFLAIWYTIMTTYFFFLNWEYADWLVKDNYGKLQIWLNPIFSTAFTVWVYFFFLKIRQNRTITALTSAGIGWNLFIFLNNNLFGWEIMYDSMFLFTLLILGGCTFGVIKVIKLCDAHWEEKSWKE